MYLMYIDESGDIGIAGSPTRYFILSGIVFHELRWSSCLDQLQKFRKQMQQKYGLRLREEIHASAFINNPGKLSRLPKHMRLSILREFADELAKITDLNIINVVVDKSTKPVDYDVFSVAWRALIQRFENTMAYRNFRGPVNPDDKGMLFPDNTDVKKLTLLVRQMRRYNPVPHQPNFGIGYRNLTISNLIEDPNFRESSNSYFVQAADLTAFLLYQHLSPNSYMKNKSGGNYFLRLVPILCKVASKNDPFGIVWL
jgi:hypothetical protein